jgi:hypothetical protein
MHKNFIVQITFQWKCQDKSTGDFPPSVAAVIYHFFWVPHPFRNLIEASGSPLGKVNVKLFCMWFQDVHSLPKLIQGIENSRLRNRVVLMGAKRVAFGVG